MRDFAHRTVPIRHIWPPFRVSLTKDELRQAGLCHRQRPVRRAGKVNFGVISLRLDQSWYV